MSRLHVVLVIADCLRPDLPILGYHRDTTPLLGPYLRRAKGFSACRSVSGWTLPACASIITGQPPTVHGLVDHNGPFAAPTLGHFLGSEYVRFGIGNNGNLVPDDIDGDYLRRLGTERNSRWNRFGWNLEFDTHRWFHRLDHDTPFVEAKAFLQAQAGSDRPHFLFLHTNIVHDYGLNYPYYRDVPEWFGDHVPPELESFHDGPAIWSELRDRVDRETNCRVMKARYDCGIREVDCRLASLFLWAPPRFGLPSEIDPRICSVLDIVPTLLELLELPRDRLPGRTLLAPAPLGHRPLAAIDRGYAYWPGRLDRMDYATTRIAIDAEVIWPLKRIRMTCDDRVVEELFNLENDPGEEQELLSLPPPTNLPSLSIVVVVNDWAELEQHLSRSPLRTGNRHQWLLFDNTGNRLSGDPSRIYARGLEQAEGDLVMFAHQDVFFPPGGEQDFSRALEELVAMDPEWGVIGSVGIAVGARQSLDEQWLCIRRNNGNAFDEHMPGLHCYGVDVCMTVWALGLQCYAVDAFVWHKYRLSDGTPALAPHESVKITRRATQAFCDEVQPSYEYVARKWRNRYPFLSTSMSWIDPGDSVYRGPLGPFTKPAQP